MQHECLTHQRFGDGEGVCDHGQLGVELAREGEQVVTLVLQRDAHRADAPRFLRLAGGELGDEEVEQLTPGCQVRAGESQHVVAQPVHERAHVAREPVRLRLALRAPGVASVNVVGIGSGLRRPSVRRPGV